MDNSNTRRKLFVLDTNILMHDPTAIYHFEEHDIYLPMVVLEELDSHKTGTSEVARNVRQTNRMLVELMSNASHEQIVSGLAIPNYLNSNKKSAAGSYFSKQMNSTRLSHPRFQGIKLIIQFLPPL